MVEFIFIIIFFSIIIALWSIQIAGESVLALRVKQWLFLSQPYPKTLLAFSRFKTWWQLMPRIFFILLPLILILVLVLRCHHFISEILDCKYCQSTYYMGLLLYFLLELPLVYSVLIAPLPILSIYLIEKIRK